MHKLITQGLILLVLTLCSVSATAESREVDGTRIDSRIYRSFESNWRKYARFACEIADGYAVIPSYDRRLDSSRGITASQAMDHLSVEWEERAGNLVQKKRKSPPREDAEAFAKALPDLAVGSYGYVASAEIVKIISKDQMLVKEIWLVDRVKMRSAYEADEKEMARRNGGEVNQELLRFNYAARIKLMEQQEDRNEGFEETSRLVGYDTRGLRVGDRWKGPNDEGFQVGVVRWETPEEQENEGRRGRRDDDPRLVLSVLAEPMRKTLDEEGFKKMLAERGMTVVAFVDLVRTMREKDRENAEERIINALLPEEIDRDER